LLKKTFLIERLPDPDNYPVYLGADKERKEKYVPTPLAKKPLAKGPPSAPASIMLKEQIC
jgi:hypothetical protein